jgi:hypothetical protein
MCISTLPIQFVDEAIFSPAEDFNIIVKNHMATAA